MRAQECEPLLELLLDLLDGVDDGLARCHVVALRVDGEPRHAAHDLAGERVEVAQGLDVVVEELDAHRVPL